jgi:hypothetical protein
VCVHFMTISGRIHLPDVYNYCTFSNMFDVSTSVFPCFVSETAGRFSIKFGNWDLY